MFNFSGLHRGSETDLNAFTMVSLAHKEDLVAINDASWTMYGVEVKEGESRGTTPADPRNKSFNVGPELQSQVNFILNGIVNQEFYQKGPLKPEGCQVRTLNPSVWLSAGRRDSR